MSHRDIPVAGLERVRTEVSEETGLRSGENTNWREITWCLLCHTINDQVGRDCPQVVHVP